ncbi:MAG TPA: iron donor protein CyaY [Orrella sp.]
MTETEFDERISAILDIIETYADEWFEKLDVDVDTKREANVLNLLFDNKVPVVINSQAPMQELWVAAPSGGFHYRFDGQHWKDTRGGVDLHDALSQIFSDATGHSVTIKL